VKKFICLLLVLFLSAATLPAFAGSAGEPAPSGLKNLASGLLELLEGGDSQEGGLRDRLSELIGQADTDKAGNDISGLIARLQDGLSGLLENLKDAASESGEKEGFDIAGLKSKLTEDLSEALENLGEKKDSLLSALKEKLGAENYEVMEDLLDKIRGFIAQAISLVEDAKLDREVAETFERLNREAEAETGAGIPNKKAATSVDQFYGNWKQVKIIVAGMEIDMSDSGEGAYFGENTYYTTSNGEKSEDYLYPETAELFIRDGVLKINCNGNWTTYVMTEDGQLVIPGTDLEIYFEREED